MGQSIGGRSYLFPYGSPGDTGHHAADQHRARRRGQPYARRDPGAYSEQSDRPLMKHLTVEVVRSNRAE
jgi:hypothetical protein